MTTGMSSSSTTPRGLTASSVGAAGTAAAAAACGAPGPALSVTDHDDASFGVPRGGASTGWNAMLSKKFSI